MLLETHAETVNGTIYVDADLEQCIKAMYPDRLTPSAVDGNTVNMSAPVDETAVNVDGMVQSYSEKKKHRGFFARLFGRE